MAHRVVGDGGLLLDMPPHADIIRDQHPVVVIQKAAQVGLTELLVNKALWAAATGYAGRGNVLFVEPTQSQMDDFSQQRFDRAIQTSPWLHELLQPEPPRRKGADRLRLKHLGSGFIFLRGAEATRQITSVDADVVILDEFDQMAEAVWDLAQKRLSSSAAPQLIVASTPTLPEAGVNGLYQQSDRRRYYLPCGACGDEQPLTFPANVDPVRGRIICRRCRAPLDPLQPGRWVAEAPGNAAIHGYHLNRLYSPWCDLRALAAASEATTPGALQTFYTSDLGEPYFPPGGALSLDDLDRCRDTYTLADYVGQDCVMGIDVGLVCHVVIREIPPHRLAGGQEPEPDAPGPRLWFAGTVSFDHLDALWEQFHVRVAAIDAAPETHKAAEFAATHPGAVWLVRYETVPGRAEQEWREPDGPDFYRVTRTDILDATVDRFRQGRVRLPQQARRLGGQVKGGVGAYYREVTALHRTHEEDALGNWVARWVKRGDDHFAHAEAYALCAERLWEPPSLLVAPVAVGLRFINWDMSAR